MSNALTAGSSGDGLAVATQAVEGREGHAAHHPQAAEEERPAVNPGGGFGSVKMSRSLRMRRYQVRRKLYVGNLCYEVTDSDMSKLFEPHGTVGSKGHSLPLFGIYNTENKEARRGNDCSDRDRLSNEKSRWNPSAQRGVPWHPDGNDTLATESMLQCPTSPYPRTSARYCSWPW
jgi:hypothetical protein